MSAAGWAALWDALPGSDAGRVERTHLEAVWALLPARGGAASGGGAAWLRGACAAELRNAAELRGVVASWRALPPACGEAEALAAVSRAAVGDAVAKTLSDAAARGGRKGSAPKVGVQELRAVLEQLDLSPPLSRHDIDALLVGGDIPSGQRFLTVDECCDVLCDGLLRPRPGALPELCRAGRARRRRGSVHILRRGTGQDVAMPQASPRHHDMPTSAGGRGSPKEGGASKLAKFKKGARALIAAGRLASPAGSAGGSRPVSPRGSPASGGTPRKRGATGFKQRLALFEQLGEGAERAPSRADTGTPPARSPPASPSHSRRGSGSGVGAAAAPRRDAARARCAACAELKAQLVDLAAALAAAKRRDAVREADGAARAEAEAAVDAARRDAEEARREADDERGRAERAEEAQARAERELQEARDRAAALGGELEEGREKTAHVDAARHRFAENNRRLADELRDAHRQLDELRGRYNEQEEELERAEAQLALRETEDRMREMQVGSPLAGPSSPVPGLAHFGRQAEFTLATPYARGGGPSFAGRALPTASFGASAFPAASDSADSADADGCVVFLNPPGWVQRAGAPAATVFDAPGQLYYTFNPPARPAQLLLSVLVSAPAVTEYVALRDADGRRGFACVVDQGALMLSGTTHRAVLDPGAWHSVCVTFDWSRRTFDLHVGTQRCCAGVAFRDRACAAAAALDIYPRESAGIAYANIRLVMGPADPASPSPPDAP